MKQSIISLKIEGKPVLGFDTALDAQAFAQAKMASFLTQKGSVVYPDGRVETWQPAGVAETEGSDGSPSTMVIWGPNFPGERLVDILSDHGRSDEALDALRYWLRARPLVEEAPGPAGVLIVSRASGRMAGEFPPGTLLFPPERLVKRCIEAEGIGSAGERIHPDLAGNEGSAYSAGVMLYEIFCATPPFSREDPLLVRQDIREGIFMPPELAAPGLDKDLAKLISRALAPAKQKSGAEPRPAPQTMEQFLGPPGSRSRDSWLKLPGKEELSKIRLEQEQYKKRKNLEVRTRRFLVRNTALISGLCIAALLLFLGVRDFIKNQEGKPSTAGMSPLEVVETYYGAFGKLDHETMSACALNKAGKQDIEMVINFFVITRMRGAYETGIDNFIAAGEWKESGSPPTDKIIFGVTDLEIRKLGGDESGGETRFEASYLLWMPASAVDAEQDSVEHSSPDQAPPQGSRGIPNTDRLRLVIHKGAWRIAELERQSN
jgi:hypothetical protein